MVAMMATREEEDHTTEVVVVVSRQAGDLEGAEGLMNMRVAHMQRIGMMRGPLNPGTLTRLTRDAQINLIQDNLISRNKGNPVRLIASALFSLNNAVQQKSTNIIIFHLEVQGQFFIQARDTEMMPILLRCQTVIG